MPCCKHCCPAFSRQSGADMASKRTRPCNCLACPEQTVLQLLHSSMAASASQHRMAGSSDSSLVHIVEQDRLVNRKSFGDNLEAHFTMATMQTQWRCAHGFSFSSGDRSVKLIRHAHCGAWRIGYNVLQTDAVSGCWVDRGPAS